MNEKKNQVDLEIGSVFTRAELNEQYGGGIQGGMLTPAGGQLMFLFSDPAAGEQYGYKYDGWVTESETVFDYTGEGAENDQQMIRRNETLRRSLDDGREVHLFSLRDTSLARRPARIAMSVSSKRTLRLAGTTSPPRTVTATPERSSSSR